MKRTLSLLAVIISGMLTAQAEPHALLPKNGLDGWAVCNYAGHGEIENVDGELILRAGEGLTGVRLTKDVPAKVNYEIELEAKRVDGNDFFCGVTFPVKDSHCSLIIGGWGGGVVGLSSLNKQDASQNETTRYMRFVSDRWYKVKLRVTDTHIQAWLDGEQIVDADYSDKDVSVRIDILESTPLGLAAWQTTSSYRNVTFKVLE